MFWSVKNGLIQLVFGLMIKWMSTFTYKCVFLSIIIFKESISSIEQVKQVLGASKVIFECTINWYSARAPLRRLHSRDASVERSFPVTRALSANLWALERPLVASWVPLHLFWVFSFLDLPELLVKVLKMFFLIT